MSKVVIEMSLSLDGYIAGPDDTPDQPFGHRNAQRLHDWLLVGPTPYEGNAFFRPQGRNRKFVDALFQTTGALLAGRRTYDLVDGWGGSHPIPGLPVVVLTHRPPVDVPKGTSSFIFCTGVEVAVEAAKRQAKEKDVMVHGASTTQQLVAAGLVDELRLHIAPLLLGAGRRLFERGADDVPLEMIETVTTPEAVHIRYRVRRDG
jgi:dihydrofolate reductase